MSVCTQSTVFFCKRRKFGTLCATHPTWLSNTTLTSVLQPPFGKQATKRGGVNGFESLRESIPAIEIDSPQRFFRLIKFEFGSNSSLKQERLRCLSFVNAVNAVCHQYNPRIICTTWSRNCAEQPLVEKRFPHTTTVTLE